MAVARREDRAKAIALRLEGKSYREISEVLGVNKSTLSGWLRDVPLSEEHRERLLLRKVTGAATAGATNRARRVALTAELQRRAVAEMGTISRRDLFIAGVVAYWAEGTKQKPWAASPRVTFTNSDAGMIRLFLAWLRLVGVRDEDLQFRIAIHERADISAAARFWSQVVGVDAAQFQHPTLKRHNPRTVRRNTQEEYSGCLIVKVRKSTDLNRKIAGWWRGICDAVVETHYPVGIIDEPSGMV